MAVDGDTAVIIARAILNGVSYPPAGVADNPENKAFWQETAKSVDAMPGGVLADLPVDWSAAETGENGTAAKFNPDQPRDKDGKWGEGGTVRTAEEAASALDSKLDYKALAGHQREWSEREDPNMKAIWAAAGEKPGQLASKSEMDDLVAGGYTELWRGLNGGADSSVYAEQYKTGKVAYAGEGIYGSGTYTTTGKDYVTRNYGSPGNAILRIALRPDAKVITAKKVEEQFEEDSAGWDTDKVTVLDDPGRYAAYLGYDAVQVPRSDGSSFYVIVNRGATVTEK